MPVVLQASLNRVTAVSHPVQQVPSRSPALPHDFLVIAGDVFLLAEELDAEAGDILIRRQTQGAGRPRSLMVTSQGDLRPLPNIGKGNFPALCTQMRKEAQSPFPKPSPSQGRPGPPWGWAGLPTFHRASGSPGQGHRYSSSPQDYRSETSPSPSSPPHLSPGGYGA